MPHDAKIASETSGTPLGAWIRAGGEVTAILASARSLAEASSDLLRAIGGWLDCESGTFWIHDPAARALVPLRIWERGSAAASRSSLSPPPAKVEHGAGLAGGAWALKRPIWSQDLAISTMAPPAGLALPILYGETCYGVIELKLGHPLQPSAEQRIAASQLGEQIGQFAGRESALRDLARHRRELADLFENAPIGVHLLDREGRILRANRAEFELLGYSREEYVGRLWREFYADPQAADAMLARLAEAENGTEVRLDEAQLRAKDGTVHWVRIEANVLREDGAFVHVRAFIRDVTERKEAEIALQASEGRYRGMVEEARDFAIHSLDAEGRVVDWNSGAERLFGFEAKDIVDRDFSVSFSPEDRADEVPSRMLRLAADEGQFRHEGFRARKDGSRFWAEVVYTALRDDRGTLQGIRQLTRDASDRRRFEALRRKSADLESANRSVVESSRRTVELLRTVAETVEGPTSEIEVALSRLREAQQDAPRSADFLALEAGVAGLRRSLQGLGEFATEVAGWTGAVPETIDLLKLALDTREMLRDAATERRVRVDVDVDPSLTDVVADRDRLRQVLYNFLSNAIRFCRERGRVSLRIQAEGASQFRMEVEDTGIGIAPEDLERVYSGKTPRHGEGPASSGLGLPATKGIVEHQGGRVGAQSTLGRGSVFFAILPRTPRSLRETPEAEVKGEPGTILVVSEDPATRASLGWTLGSEGFEAVHAANAEEGVDLGRERRFDAIAVDLLLGGMGAIDFVAVIRSGGASRAARCIVGALGTSEAGAAGLPAADILPRPVPADRLFAALERARVPRGPKGAVLLVDSDVRLLEATSRSLQILGYRAIGEPDGDAALRACAEKPPAAVVLSPFIQGMDCFSFLTHLRKLSGLTAVPVFLAVPRELDPEQRASLESAANVAARERLWPKSLKSLSARER